MHVLFICKNEEDLIKNEGTGIFTTFLPLYVYRDFTDDQGSAVLVPIWSNFNLVRGIMNVLVTCKNQEDPIKNEGARVMKKVSLL